MTRPAAVVRGVSKTYGHGATLVRALRDVDLEIYPGELTLIEGPSGSGKTTLLHILGLLQRADAGEVWIDGSRMDALPESRLPDERRRRVALIFQGFNLLDALTLRENVAVAGLLMTGSLDGLPSMDYLQRVGLERRAAHLPAEVSGGEKQRTAIARALACQGRLVLADEPTANLDWSNAQDTLRCLADLARHEGRAVVIVSHDSRIEPFVDRIVGLVDGRISSDHRPRGKAVPDHQETSVSAAPAGEPRRSGAVWSRAWPALLVVLLASALAFHLFPGWQRSVPPSAEAHNANPLPYLAAAPAVVEPSTHLVALRSERQGRIRAILKNAGDRITRGEPLVLLDDTTAVALVNQRRADLSLAEANLAKLEAWDRPEERARARASVARAEARLDRAIREWKRVELLHTQSSASETELNEALEEKRLAAAALDEVQQLATMSETGPTPEEVRVATAKVEQAQAAVRIAEAELALRTILSPLDGHVVYRHLEPGEVVDPESPIPILSIGNLDQVRLRAEVDEADIERVCVGQRINATAEAFGVRTFGGRVVHLEPMMGRKSIRTQRTTEREDTKVREVLIALDANTPPLPIDLQMTVRFIAPGRADSGDSVPASGPADATGG